MSDKKDEEGFISSIREFLDLAKILVGICLCAGAFIFGAAIEITKLLFLNRHAQTVIFLVVLKFAAYYFYQNS